MSKEKLKLLQKPMFDDPVLIIGLTGWMDGGEVSTGTIKYLVRMFKAEKMAEIKSTGFYIYNFPGGMEVSALFRPHCRIEDGLVEEFKLPENIFYSSPEHNVILFSGKEPNMGWEEDIECIFEVCREFRVKRVYFIGSVAGVTPHTREPNVYSSSSSEEIRDRFRKMGFKMSNYEGPASIITQMMPGVQQRNLELATIVVETPAYVQGYNPRCIETAIKCIARLLDIKVELEELKQSVTDFTRRIDKLLEGDEELAKKVKALEREHDREAFDSDMTDIKTWLANRGLKPE
jgi:predicted ATP-grasp superfamily ATP-dependent carboligase